MYIEKRKEEMVLNKEKLGELIINCERQMYCTAKTILKDDQDCADAIQETIVKAFQKIDTLKKEKYVKTWLIRILINECHNIIRKESKCVSLENVQELAYTQVGEWLDYGDLYSAVRSLKEELRMPVILYYGEDFSIREIAQILDITEGAVQKRLSRARAKLKVKLEQTEVLV